MLSGMLCAVKISFAVVAPFRRNLLEGRAHPLDIRRDEAGMIVKYAQLVDLLERRSDFCLRPLNILAVLATAGIAAVGAREKRQRVLNAIVAHLPQRVGQIRLPVAVAPVDRQLQVVRVEFLLAAPRSARGSAR